MKNLVILTFASASLAAFFEASGLSPRDTTQAACSDVGRKSCGTVCIEQSQTCCPDEAGGCPTASICWLGGNGKYGCCPVGETCQGAGGSDITTDTINGPGSTSTVAVLEPTTSGGVETTAGETMATETTTPLVTGPIGTVTPIPNTTVNSNTTGPVPTVPTASSPPVTAGAAVNSLAVSGLLGVVLIVFTVFV